uniref:INTS5_N domain-containing protein n=1 Tax=Globodera pallida TaxID=36090 RepID=A0A183CIP6_GLOPA
MMEKSSAFPPTNPRLAQVQACFANFFSIANLGDTNSAYRGKPIWTNYQTDDICQPVMKLLIEVPASRDAVLYFISNLIHENVHLHLSEQERKDASKSVDYSSLQRAVLRLLTNLNTFRVEYSDKKMSFSISLLKMLFELFSELFRKNCQRPFFTHQPPPPALFLSEFQQIQCVSELFALLDSTFASLMQIRPESAVFAFVSAHKSFFANFDWVAIHIAETFPTIVVHLVRVGAEEFCAHCNEMLNPAIRLNAAHVVQLQDEYNTRLRLFTEVFLYMERKRKLELRACFTSIIEKFLRTGDNWRELLFLIKLSLFSPTVTLPFMDELLPHIIQHPFLADRLHELAANPALSIAVSPTNFLQNFLRKMVENASTEHVFDLGKIVSTFL